MAETLGYIWGLFCLRNVFTMSQYYTSGEFAEKAHVSIRTIRYYDQKNLLKPAARTKGGARRYTDQDFAKLQQILLLKYLGFSLSDIRIIYLFLVLNIECI